MKPSFALLLSQDGLVLCHRTSDGWLRVGEVLLTATDVAGELAALRTRALEIAKAQKLGPLITKLVLPNSEILYDRISVEGVTGPDYDAVIRERLDGRTPYAMDELCYDYVVTQGEAQVAVVARETLAEAEAFATEHGLEPVCFAAVPPKGAFSGEAMFGTTRLAPDLLAPTETLERDMAPVVILGETDWVGARAASQSPTESVAPPPEADAPVATAAPPEPTPEPAQDPDPTPPEPAVATLDPVEAQPDLPAASSVDEMPAPVAPAPPRAQADAAAKLAPPEAVVAAEKLAELAAPAKRSSRSLGLILTLALLAAMVLVGVVAAVLEQDDVVSTGAAPAAVDEASPALEPAPEQRAEATPTPAPDTAEDTAPPVIAEAAPEPTEQPGTPAITAMTDGPPQPAAAAPVVSRFDALPTPEEVAEGEEATVPGTPAPAPAPTTAPVAVSDAPSSPALPATDTQISDAEPPVAARDLRPPLIETETRYAASGIWQRSPDPLQPIAPTMIGDLYVAALDRDVAIEDALALPAYMDSQDLRPVSPQPPVAPGQFFDLSADGFVTPTPEGALTPEGVLVFSEPGTRPSPRPQITPVTTTEDLRLAELASQRPPPRPKNVAELQERAELDGRSRAELAGLTPTPRPASIQELAAAETPEAVPANAMARSVYPDQRPSNFAQLVAAARAARVATAEPSTGQNRGVAAASTASFAAAAPAPQRETAPTIPTTASVARQATIEDALRLNRINLIGVYGTPNSRRALVRLASGRYVKVEVGDRVDGGRVGAIGETSLQYTKGGRNITLEMPRG